ncbi:hypothetical protein PanWU01x14_013880 [Parasponia andersonii]|uniref:Uncharacterized protein n=1 Tax=Parasponia andersonii TaxID=3476 RepID=A0A2P5E175_PARAD|nr:hypothetical protein PanWU01x14_013880 [Parasponia andersonii]
MSEVLKLAKEWVDETWSEPYTIVCEECHSNESIK